MQLPTTIITGFLGAGKTTLLNALIRQQPNVRFAIIENEIGAVNLDSDFIVGANEDIFQITDGCLCCTMNVALSRLLGELVRRKAEFDHLIIETTGVADPSAVAAVFVTDLAVQTHFRLDGTVCVTDCLHIEGLLAERETEAARQLSFADALFFTKTDLISPEYLATLQQRLAEINPFARQFVAAYDALQVAELLQLGSFQPKTVERRLTDFRPVRAHQHGNITAQTYRYAQAFDFLKFRHFVQVLLHFQAMRIYRM